MKLEVGEYYLTADGRIMQLKKEHFIQENYSILDGTHIKNKSKDLIAHIPKQLHKHILNEINSYYTDKDFKEVVDSVWEK